MEEEKDNEQRRGERPFTLDDFNEFMAASGWAEQWKILLAHAEKNHKIVSVKRLEQAERDREEIGKRFNEFLHAKGLKAKFRLAFSEIAEGTRRQFEADKANFEAMKRRSAENNPEFTEFLHTKGVKAKFSLVVENLKKSAAEASKRTAAAIDAVSARTRESIERARSKTRSATPEATPEDLTREFNEFLKAKGLGEKYFVEITEENA